MPSETARESRVLIVSPHFPPVNAPDMQRVRMSLPFYRQFGWRPYVLAVAPSGPVDPLLAETVPSDVFVERVPAIPAGMTRLAGVGNLALRAMPFLHRAAARLIRRHRIDLAFFSTTHFLAMPLGRVWWRRFGVPYVLDIQDPWLSDYYELHPDSEAPPKYSIARRLHAVFEPWTMRDVAGLMGVSDGYLVALRHRYPWLTERMCTTLPFGGSLLDFKLLDHRPQPNRCFSPLPGICNGVYVGRGGDDMRTAARILFGALSAGRISAPDLFQRVRLHFVGTDYATDGRARRTIAPIAEDMGLGDIVSEQTDRVPYFEALQLQKDADFLVLIASDDADYTPSKVYPYLMARKPILAVVHERSSLLPVLREANAGVIVTFSERNTDALAAELAAGWRGILERRIAVPDERVIARFSAREMTRRQCLVFDDAIARTRARAA